MCVRKMRLTKVMKMREVLALSTLREEEPIQTTALVVAVTAEC